jgi:regulator of ribonuclease activity A
MNHLSTADLYDSHSEKVAVADAGLVQYGGIKQFYGQAVTLACPLDNTLVGETLNEHGEGKVLVVDAGANIQFAFLGDKLAAKAIKNGWSGIVVHGCIRDIEIIREMNLGVMALGSTPRKTEKKGAGSRDVLVACHGISVNPGDYIYADENGLLCSPTALI